MTRPPFLLPEAKSDVADAYLWYEEQLLGLGMEFLCSQDPEKWRSRLPI
jgi:hypothetical protein